MNKQKNKTEESEHAKLTTMLQIYEKVLHPNFFSALVTQINAAYEENKTKAYADAKISNEALQIEEMLKDLFIRLKEAKDQRIKSFFLKCFYKELLTMFNTAGADQPASS